MQPSLCSVDGSCVGERISWTYLTLTSMDVIDSLNAAEALYSVVHRELIFVNLSCDLCDAMAHKSLISYPRITCRASQLVCRASQLV